MLNIRTYPLGFIQTNCYVISNAKKECLIFDPGGNGEQLVKELNRLHLKPLAVLLTHAHFDHIGAVDDVRDAYGIPVYIHSLEKSWLTNAEKNGSAKYAEIPNITAKEADILISREEIMTLGDFEFSISHTPGHSPGSVTFYFESDGFAIVGDTLFQNSVGRTDLPGGNEKQLLTSIHSKLLTLPDATVIYPGHGPASTIQAEMDSNPFLNGF